MVTVANSELSVGEILQTLGGIVGIFCARVLVYDCLDEYAGLLNIMQMFGVEFRQPCQRGAVLAHAELLFARDDGLICQCRFAIVLILVAEVGKPKSRDYILGVFGDDLFVFQNGSGQVILSHFLFGFGIDLDEFESLGWVWQERLGYELHNKGALCHEEQRQTKSGHVHSKSGIHFLVPKRYKLEIDHEENDEVRPPNIRASFKIARIGKEDRQPGQDKQYEKKKYNLNHS